MCIQETATQSPKVSVIVPVYNGAEFMREAIDSALRQTYENIEILVINDGSNDGGQTDKIAREYGDKIRYFVKENGGVSSALNLGLEKMTGEYFSWLSHDDKYEPEKVAESVRILQKFDFREDLIAITGIKFINAQSETIREIPQTFPAGEICDGHAVIARMLTKGTLDGCGMLIPKAAFQKCGGFDETLRYNQDALMWYKFFSNGCTLVSDAQHNTMYRQHKNQTSKTRRDLLIHDTLKSSAEIIPMFTACDTADGGNLLYLYAMRTAMNDCRAAVQKCVQAGKAAKVLSRPQILRIHVQVLYGKLRVLLKKIYVKLMFRR